MGGMVLYMFEVLRLAIFTCTADVRIPMHVSYDEIPRITVQTRAYKRTPFTENW